MTRKQSECLAFIARFMEQTTVSPTLQQIAEGIGITSIGSVARYLDILEQRGFIRRFKYRARSIQIIDPGEVKLNAEIFALVKDYASKEHVNVDVATNELLRQVLGAAA
jgi:SOS-response transcriptional repressor LexA